MAPWSTMSPVSRVVFSIKALVPAAGKHRSGKLILAEINQLGARIDKIYEFINKGVHDRVSQTEGEQCMMHTYIIVGDVLRIEDGTSAILVEDESSQLSDTA